MPEIMEKKPLRRNRGPVLPEKKLNCRDSGVNGDLARDPHRRHIELGKRTLGRGSIEGGVEGKERLLADRPRLPDQPADRGSPKTIK
jgi:hypothetical protein